jgi:general secretion pathway protein G
MEGAPAMRWFQKSSDGFSFVEIIVVTAIMAVLATAALPIARVSMRRQKEADCRRELRNIRTAIDQFKDYAESGRLAQSEVQFGNENYPSSLE